MMTRRQSNRPLADVIIPDTFNTVFGQIRRSMFNPNKKDARAIFRQLLAKMDSGEMECVSLEIEFKPISDTFRIVGEMAPQRMNRSRSVVVNMDMRDYTSPSEMQEIMEGDPIEQVALSSSYPGGDAGRMATVEEYGLSQRQAKIIADQLAAENTAAKDKKKSENAAAKAKELATTKARMKTGAIPPRDIIFEDE